MSIHKLSNSLPVQPKTPSADEVQQKFKEVSSLYEKQFLREMVKAMRATVDRSQLTEVSMDQKIYEQKMDEEYVEAWGDNGGIGLADLIYTQLNERFGSALQQLPKAKGPLPIAPKENGFIHENGAQPFRVEPPASGQTQDLGYFFPGQTPVTSPWAGEVSEKLSLRDGRQVVSVNHGELSSRISYSGSADVKIGDKIEAGQKLGVAANPDGGVSWRVSRT